MKSSLVVFLAVLFCNSAVLAQSNAPNSAPMAKPPAGMNAPGFNTPAFNAPGFNASRVNAPGTNAPRTDDSSFGVMGVMMEYQKQMNREAREDRKLSSDAKKAEIRAKKEKLRLEQEKIGAMKKEADERSDYALEAGKNQSNAATKAKIDTTKSPLPKKNFLEK